MLFVIQMENVQCLRPNDATDPEFGEALRQAERAGVRLLAMDCRVTPDSMTLCKAVPICL